MSMQSKTNLIWFMLTACCQVYRIKFIDFYLDFSDTPVHFCYLKLKQA